MREDQGDFVDAERQWREVMAIRSKNFGAEHPSALRSLRRVATTLSTENKFAEAEDLLLSGQELVSRAYPDGDKQRALMDAAMVTLYDVWNKAEPGQGHDEQSKVWRDKQPPATSPATDQSSDD